MTELSTSETRAGGSKCRILAGITTVGGRENDLTASGGRIVRPGHNTGMAERQSAPQFSTRIPTGDTRDRRVCDGCGWIDYENPKVVVGAVCVYDQKILLCRRDIEPRRGHWTIPAGYLELGESTEEGAAREVREEALADVDIGPLIGLYSIPRISQVLLIYRATMPSSSFGVGEETSEAGLFDASEIPWDDLAFPSVRWALEHYFKSKDQSVFAPFAAPYQTGPLPKNGEPLKHATDG